MKNRVLQLPVIRFAAGLFSDFRFYLSGTGQKKERRVCHSAFMMTHSFYFYLTRVPWLLSPVFQILLIYRFARKWPQRKKAVLRCGLSVLACSQLILARQNSPKAAFVLAVLLIFWQSASLQDLCTWTFSAWWFVLGVLVFLLLWSVCGLSFFSWMNLVYPLLSLPLIALDQMGRADFWFLLLAALCLSSLQMGFCFLLSCLFGVIWGLSDKDHLIPYVSCLALAFVLSLVMV